MDAQGPSLQLPRHSEYGRRCVRGGAREQATIDHGATLEDEQVTGVESNGEGFTVTTESGEHDARYVVLATGAKRHLADELGCDFTEDHVVDVDVAMETTVENAYVTGAMVRAEEWQAIISAGDGAAAALNILAKEKASISTTSILPRTPVSSSQHGRRSGGSIHNP